MRRAIAMLAACIGIAGAADAQPATGDLRQCNTRFVRFVLAENAALTTEQSTPSTGCAYAFPGDAYTVYETVTVTKRPRHLAITPNSNGFGFSLRVRNGYRGPDSYTIKACGRGREGPGCITLTFDVTVH
jgi:hypothetical protein